MSLTRCEARRRNSARTATQAISRQTLGYAVFRSVTMGSCLWPAWKRTCSVKRAPHLPFTRAWGSAHGRVAVGRDSEPRRTKVMTLPMVGRLQRGGVHWPWLACATHSLPT
jgi:hypothetical protein